MRKRNPDQAFRPQYYRYRRSAKVREIDWQLTLPQFVEMAKQYCAYCNAPPRDYKSRLKRGRGAEVITLMNGIDRVNSDIGYIEYNCVPCCSTCNMMKMTLTGGDFIEQVMKIYHYYAKLQNEDND
jgi:hypothetical protein